MERNWAGNVTYGPANWHAPTSVAELQGIVSRSSRAKALGSRHSFNPIADTVGDLISTDRLPVVLDVDAGGMSVRVSAGLTYGRLGPFLHREGYGLANLASLPHIGVVGACATGTHGSGNQVPNLAAAVSGLELVRADGEIIRLKRGDPDFAGAVVNLGALGVVTELTLDVQPTYDVSQFVYDDLPFETVFEEFDAVTSAAYSVSLFTGWTSGNVEQVWLKRRGGAAFPNTFFGARPSVEERHPIRGVSPESCTRQLGVAGPWQDRLPHFRPEVPPSAEGEELQSEYLVPRLHAVAALREVLRLAPSIAPLLHVSEIRTMAGDDLWTSPAYGGPTVGIHFTWLPRWPEVSALLPDIERALAPFKARPHWGKLFAMGGRSVTDLYPKWPEFHRLADRLDPSQKFLNGFLREKLFPVD